MTRAVKMRLSGRTGVFHAFRMMVLLVAAGVLASCADAGRTPPSHERRAQSRERAEGEVVYIILLAHGDVRCVV